MKGAVSDQAQERRPDQSFIYSLSALGDSPIFVFQNESLTIACTGGETDPILIYRKAPTDDPISYFLGSIPRAEGAEVRLLLYRNSQRE